MLDLPPPLDADESVAGPCRDCLKSTACKRRQLACRAFALFVSERPHSEWRDEPRVPSRRVFLALFHEDRAA